MANPKRKGKRTSVIQKNIRFRVTHRDKHLNFTSLSDVEDANDIHFWDRITQDAANNAINENKAMNIPVTVLEDGWVVKKSHDGTTTKIKKVETINEAFKIHSLTKGSILHVK